MSKSIAIPNDLYKKAAELAAKDHVSIDEFVSEVLANRLASHEYIEMRPSFSIAKNSSKP